MLFDPELKKRLEKRSRIMQAIRDFFVSEGFLEVQTPILVKFAGQEPYLDPMKVGHLGYLITSPEYAHKKLLAQGLEKTFEITKCFRDNEPVEGWHNPEFTMLEWYRVNADYTKIMKDAEKMIQYVSRAIGVKPFPAWERITVTDAWKKYAKVDLKIDRPGMARICKEKGYSVNKDDTYDDLFFKVFLTEIEPNLGVEIPTILYQYPPQMASLARCRNGWAERFELYINGIEIANAFSELNDAKEQKRRFLQEQNLRKKLGKEIIPIDNDFLKAVGKMPRSAGIALGVDRLAMLLLGVKNIEKIIIKG